MEYVTLTHWAQLNEETALHLCVHVFPFQSADAQPYAWFTELKSQELLALVYNRVVSKAKDIDSSNSDSSDYHVERSRNLRILMRFKPMTERQHLVVPEQPTRLSGLIPQATFVSDEGRKVLPFLNLRTKGSGYKSFRVLPTYTEVYVDQYPPTDSRGIYKIRSKLDPQHSLKPLLQQQVPPLSAELGLDNVCGLAEIPVGGLASALAEKKRKLSVKVKKLQAKKRLRVTPGQKPQRAGIKEMLAKKDAISLEEAEIIDLSEDIIEDFFDFTSQEVEQPKSSVIPPLKDYQQCDDETPPLSPNPPASMSHYCSTSPIASTMVTTSITTTSTSLSITKPPNSAPTRENHSSEGKREENDDDTVVDLSTPKVSPAAELLCSEGMPPREEFDTSDDLGGIVTPEVSLLSELHQHHDHEDASSGDIFDELLGYCAEGDSCQEGDEEKEKETTQDAGTVIDLTKEVIDIYLSEEDSTSVTETSQSAKKRKKLKNSKAIINGVRVVSELSLLQVRKWMYLKKPLLVDIFKRDVYSRRHEVFFSNSSSKRNALRYQIDTQMFTEEQIQLITDFLLGVFCGKDMKLFSYVMSVLLPECVVRIIGDVHDVSFQEAEKMMMNYRRPD